MTVRIGDTAGHKIWENTPRIQPRTPKQLTMESTTPFFVIRDVNGTLSLQGWRVKPRNQGQALVLLEKLGWLGGNWGDWRGKLWNYATPHWLRELCLGGPLPDLQTHHEGRWFLHGAHQEVRQGNGVGVGKGGRHRQNWPRKADLLCVLEHVDVWGQELGTVKLPVQVPRVGSYEEQDRTRLGLANWMGNRDCGYVYGGQKYWRWRQHGDGASLKYL